MTRTPNFDGISKADIVITTEHANIHRGTGFLCSTVGSVDIAGVHDSLIFVPPNVYPHLRIFEYDPDSAPCDLYLYEAPTVVATGTPCSVQNANRNSSNVSSVGIYRASSVSAVGTFLEVHKITGAKQSGGTHEGALTEWIFKPDTIYMTRLDNKSGNKLSFGAFEFWYE